MYTLLCTEAVRSTHHGTTEAFCTVCKFLGCSATMAIKGDPYSTQDYSCHNPTISEHMHAVVWPRGVAGQLQTPPIG